MMRYHLKLAAASLLLVGAGCAGTPPAQQPDANAPAVNSSATNAPTGGEPSGTSDAGTSGTTATAGLKQYNSAPYDFSYPSRYILTDHPMNDEERQSYLDRNLDAPIQNVSLADEQRPKVTAGEGPATLRVIQWNNSQGWLLRQWARKTESYTGFTEKIEAAKTFSEAPFMGYPSLSYEYEGLYGGKARLIALNGTVLHVSADFDTNMGNTNMAAFDTILSTLKIAK